MGRSSCLMLLPVMPLSSLTSMALIGRLPDTVTLTRVAWTSLRDTLVHTTPATVVEVGMYDLFALLGIDS